MIEDRSVLVAAGILVEDGRVLLSQRKPGSHLAGLWEFPGGKVGAFEDPRHAVRRELTEELGIDVDVGEVIEVTFHRYSDAATPIILLFFDAVRRSGSPEPQALDVAAFEWAGLDGLDDGRFPAADVHVVHKVRARLLGGVVRLAE